MAEKVIHFSDQEQQKVEGMIIDKDGDAALRFLSDLLGAFKAGESHACGPKAAEGPSGHG